MTIKPKEESYSSLPQERHTLKKLRVEELQVRYQDLDTCGHVTNTVPPIFFEAARMPYSFGPRPIGWSLDLLRPDTSPGALRPRRVTVRYRALIHLEGILFCGMSVRHLSRRSFVWDYELRAGEGDKNGRLVAEGPPCRSSSIQGPGR
jgi:acyl-CoA thioesterase FadM